MGARTPWYVTRFCRGGGTRAQSFSRNVQGFKAKTGVYIEVIVDKWLIPEGGEFLFKATGNYFGMPNRTWEGWLKEMKAKRKA